MKVKLLTATPEILISDCAKVCYANNTDKNLVESLTHHHKHLAVLRFSFAVISIENISIACQNQLVRSKHLDFLVESKRYVNAEKGNFNFIAPDNVDDNVKNVMSSMFDANLKLYNDLLAIGVKKEDARAILPLNTSTKMNVAGNLQAWIDAIKLRVSSKAQREIRELFISIWELLKIEYPNVFIDSFVVNGKTLKEWLND